MQSNRRLLRLGSFEQLESRALLAHAGPPGMGAERILASSPWQQPNRMGEVAEITHHSPRGSNYADLQTGADPRSGGDSFRERPGNSDHQSFQNDRLGSSRNKDVTMNDAYSAPAANLTTSTMWLAPVTTPVVIFITIPAAEPLLPRVTSSASVPPNESSRNEPPRSSALVAPPSNFNEPFAGSSSSARGNGSARLDGLALTTSLLLRRTDSETTLEENDEQNTKLTTEDSVDSSDELRQESVQAAHEATIQQSPADSGDADLIELADEDPFQTGKRKSRKGPAIQRESLHAENWKLPQSRLRNATDVQSPETWRNAAEFSEQTSAADDDLIDLLAVEQLVPQSPVTESRQFEAAAPQLQATLGYYQAVELNPATISTVDSATVAATALPAAAGK